jgi:DNA-binding transcriptional MerR regulator
MGQERFRLGRLAAEVGLDRTSLRYHERQGLLAPAPRVAVSQRRYTIVQRHRPRCIIKTDASGPTLAGIGDVPTLHREGQEPCTPVRVMLERTPLAVEAQLRGQAAFRDEPPALSEAAVATAARGGEVCAITERPVPGRQPDAVPTL